MVHFQIFDHGKVELIMSFSDISEKWNILSDV